MKTHRSLLVLAIALALSGLLSGRALAKEIVGVTVSGPGLPGEIEISDAKAREVASAPWFDLIATGKPADLTDVPYYALRMAIGAEGKVVATNVFHYYPGGSDRPGYFYYAECLGCSSGSTGEWYRIRDGEDLAMRELLVSLGAPAGLMGAAEEGAAQAAGADLSAPRSSSGEDSIPGQGYVPIIAVLAAALLALAAFGILHRRTSRRAAEG